MCTLYLQLELFTCAMAIIGNLQIKGKLIMIFVYVLWEIHVCHSNQLYHMYSTCNSTFNIKNILFHFWGKEGEGGKVEGERKGGCAWIMYDIN